MAVVAPVVCMVVLSASHAGAEQVAARPMTAASTPTEIAHPERDYMGSTFADHLDWGDQAGADAPETWVVRPRPQPQARPAGVDVSNWQGEINWSAVADDGIRFAYIKATEGTSYVDPWFRENRVEARRAGIIRGAYHFALPDRSSGAAQGRFLIDNGGGWSADGVTLPPVLDIEYNPYGPDCYGLSDREMVDWIADFSATVKAMSGRYPVIYTTTDWWQRCTGNYGGFADTNASWIARWDSRPGPLPNGWSYHTFWQYTSTGRVAGISGNVDRDVFNGPYDRLQALARCPEEDPC